TVTVNFTPAIRNPNWSSGNSPTVNWTTSTAGGNVANNHSNGLEDMTVDLTGSTATNYGIEVTNNYSCWIKGVRIVGFGPSTYAESNFINGVKNFLLANSYIDTRPNSVSMGSLSLTLVDGSESDNLHINNIFTGGLPWEGTGGSTRKVM